MSDGPYAPAQIRVLPSWLLGRAAARGHQLVAQALAAEDIRMMHHAALATVAEQEPVSQAELGRILKVHPKDMSAIVNDLHQRGLIVRHRDRADRRKNAISLSPEGTQLLHRTARLGEQANAELIAALTQDEREQLITLLTRIVSPVDQATG